mmetsp:Transcript_30138/g.96889  ORF Transcript_30138/g.96889 Transcript_30138/m.96889 type:complete len:221 (+) Transcript_30138:72-734(+)
MGCAASSNAATTEDAVPKAVPAVLPSSAASPAYSPPKPLPPAPPASLHRELTTRSLAVCTTLDTLEKELDEMQATLNRADEALANEAPPIALRSTLASLHGSATALLATRLDALHTADLTSGRDEARAKRKALVAAAERVIERAEAQIREVDLKKARQAAEAAVASSAEATTQEAVEMTAGAVAEAAPEAAEQPPVESEAAGTTTEAVRAAAGEIERELT